MKLEKLIYDILQSRKKSFLVYLITFILFVLSIATFPTQIIKAKMLPSKDSDTFSIYVDLKDGSSINHTKEVTSCIASNLQKNENITNISVFLKEGQPLDFAALVKQSALKDKESQAEMMINIKKAKERNITSYNLITKLRGEVQKNCSLYDANIKFIELPAGPPVLASIVVEIYGGNNFQNRRDFSLKIAQILKNQATLVDIDVLADDDFIMYELELDDKKATLMLEVVTDENTKDDIFSIVTLGESDLKKLGKLVQEDNFSALLDKATDLLQQQIETEADFRHKHEIGTYIERLIREKLSDELQGRVSFNKESVETTNIQGGQDIIVLLDEIPIYFIEVKSRWNSQNSVSMSKLQLQRAVEENERYALCTVDITRYIGKNDRYKLSTDEILPLTKFVTNIGNTIKPLIEDNLEAEKEQDTSIHLIDYRGIIPQDIIQSGKDFNNFIELVSETISRNANVVNVL